MTSTYTTSHYNKNNKTLKIIASFCVCVLLVSVICIFLPVNGEQRIYSDLIRLHIIANSNSEADQKLKLDLRDYILEDIENLTGACANIDEAIEKINGEIINIQSKTLEFVNGRGYDYSVSVILEKEIYPTRKYVDDAGNDFLLPAGKYISLKIEIGDSDGENWWCVLFPPICLSGSKIEDELAIAGYTNEQINILKKDKGKKYEIRFKILEVLADLFD